MSTPSLDPATGDFDGALRALDRALVDSRAQWDDDARKVFDRRFLDPLRGDAAQAARELHRLAQELASAARVLDNLG